MHIIVVFLLLAQAAGAPSMINRPAEIHSPAADTKDAQEAAAHLKELISGNPAAAARAEALLASMGRRATPSMVGYLLGEQRDRRAVAAILRVIAKVKDPDAARGLWLEWERSPESRDGLIEAWAAMGPQGVSPLAGYFPQAVASQQERILEALGAVGEPAVPALQGLKSQISAEQGGLAERFAGIIDTMIAKAPVVSLARKGPVAWRDLELMAGDPNTPHLLAEEAVKGLAAMAALGDEGALALQRLAGKSLTPQLHALVDPAADEARLLSLSRKGESAVAEYASILRDAAAREGIKMGAINGLFGIGAAALPVMAQLSSELPAGPATSYLKELTAALRSMPAVARAGPAPAVAASPAPAAPSSTPGEPPAGETCIGDTEFGLISRIETRGMPLSPRWFRRTTDGTRIIFTTVEAGFYRLVTAMSDGSGSVTLAPLAHQFSADWSWEGRKIAFLGSKAPIGGPIQLNDVYIADPDGKNLVKVTSDAGLHTSPIWLTKRDEIMYATNRLRGPGLTSPSSEADSVLYRRSESSGKGVAALSLIDRIVTAIEAGPDLRYVAFLSWKVKGTEVGPLFLHVTDPDGMEPREMILVPAPAGGSGDRPLTVNEALAAGGDITWSPDGRLVVAAGKIVDVEGWRLVEKIDPAKDAYATRLASRTILTQNNACGYFNDTRQIGKRCPPSRAVLIVADCRGALLWLDEKRSKFALYDALNGNFGLVKVRFPKASTREEAPSRR